MNKLNSPVVILALIILSVCNMLLSISILTKIKNENEIVDDADADKEQSETATTSTTQVKEESLSFTIYDTTTDARNSNWKENLKYDYRSSKEQNFFQLCMNMQNYGNSMYGVSCDEDQCLIHIYSSDSYGNSHSEDKLFNSEVSKNIIEKFESQEEITADMLINEKESSNGQIVMEYTNLPSYIIMKSDSNPWDSNQQCYYIDDEFLNYINSLRWGSNNVT